MSLQDVLARFDKSSPYRELIRDLASEDADRRVEAYRRGRTLDRFNSCEEARTPAWFISEADARAILYAAETLEFPLPEYDWEDGLENILTHLWRNPYPILTTAIGRIYGKLTDTRRRCALLTLLGTIGTREAAEAFMACVQGHGWPSEVHGRFIEELEKLLVHYDVLLPDIVPSAGRLSKYVAQSVLGAIANRRFKVEDAGDRLEALAPYTLASLKKALRSAARKQHKPGIEWRFAQNYHSARYQACVLLDLAGRLSDFRLSDLLGEAMGFQDPRIVTFATVARLRRGEKVGQRPIARAAACHETRAILFNELDSLKLLRLFPEKWRTWEAFGAAQMVEWLLYPAELGREPDDLRLEQTYWIDQRSKRAMFIWQFRTQGDPWMAAVSGPHLLQGKPRPLDGCLTFSRFEKWSSGTPLEHLTRCAGTAEEIFQAVDS
jgi:hypothetical protein